jgi:hypothetical protein
MSEPLHAETLRAASGAAFSRAEVLRKQLSFGLTNAKRNQLRGGISALEQLGNIFEEIATRIDSDHLDTAQRGTVPAAHPAADLAGDTPTTRVGGVTADNEEAHTDRPVGGGHNQE